MCTPGHHPPEEVLVDYVSGKLFEGAALIAATHLSLCAQCRSHVQELEAISGALLETEPEEAVSASCLENVLARLDQPAPALSAMVPPRLNRSAPPAVGKLPLLPQPLRSYVQAVGSSLESLAWKTVSAGFDIVSLGLERGTSAVHLLRLGPSSAVPHHGHDGLEMNLVLSGGYEDDRGRFNRGDFVVDRPGYAHRPLADAGGCLCVGYTEKPLRFPEYAA